MNTFRPGLKEHLASNIKGQPEACELVARTIERAMVGMKQPDEPIGSLLLLGPTGSGKTEMVLSLAEFLYGSKDAAVRYDMAEFNGPNSIETLIGASKHEQGRLGDDIDQRPEGGILLVDEIEKAHRDVTALLLAPTSAARITMANGAAKDLSNWLIVATSNLGAANAMQMERSSYSSLIRIMRMEAAKFLRPELLARLDVAVFRRLEASIQVQIAELHLERELERIKERFGVDVECDEAVLHQIVRVGYSEREGARPMRRAIKTLLGDAVVDFVTKGRVIQDSKRIRFIVVGSSVELEDLDDLNQSKRRTETIERTSIFDLV